MIRFHLLGGLDLRHAEGDELRSILAQPKRLALLAYLTLEASNGFCRRDRLLALFWPEFDAEHSRLALRQALHFLRGSLGPKAIVSRGDEEIGIAADCLWCDAVAFQESVDRGNAEDALELYRGDLLPGFFISDASPEFERWLDDERTRLRRLAAVSCWHLAEAAERAGKGPEAALRGRDAVRLAPDDEAGVRKLIGLLDRLGDRAGALRTYDTFATRLRSEFDLDPAPETRVLIDAVRARNEASAFVTAASAPATGAGRNIESDSRIRLLQDHSRSRRRVAGIAIAALGLIAIGTAVIARASLLDAPISAPPQSGTGSLAARRLYEEGLRALFRGESRGAHDLFAAALGEDSTFAMAAYYAGLARQPSDANAARLYFAQSIRLADRAPERDRLLIKLAAQFSDHAVALAVAETLASRFPSEPAGHLALGHLRFAAGDFLSAIPHARRSLAMDSLGLEGNAPLCRACEAYALMANAYLSADSLPAAERTVRAWVARQPSSSLAWNFLSVVLSSAAQHERARSALDEAERLQPSPDAVYRQVEIAIRAEDYVQADQLLRARLNHDAGDANALWYLGISLRNQGRLHEALVLSERGKALSDSHAWLARGQILFELGRFREAAAEFDSVARFFGPTGPMATRGASARHLSWNLTHTATALAAAGDTAALQGLADSIEAVARYSSYGRDWRLPDHVRGLSWLARGQPERAVQSFRAAIFSANVGYTRTNLELARALLALGRPAEAVSVLQPALRGAVEASNYYLTRTELHELLGRSFQLANQPDSAATHYRAVVAAWSNGDPLMRARADTARSHLAALRK